MPSPSTSVVVQRVFERVLQIAQSEEDPRAFKNSTHTGMRIETGKYGPVDVSLEHDRAGNPQQFKVHGASIGFDEKVPLGTMEPNGTVTSNIVSYRERGVPVGAVSSASLSDVMAAVSEAIK